MDPRAIEVIVVFVSIPFGWALIWAFCVAVNKWAKR